MFSIPIILGELLQNLYNSVDALVVGNFVSRSALAAVSVCSIIANMIIAFFNGMSVGANVAVSREYGRRNEEGIRRSSSAAFSFAVVLGVVVSALGILLSPWLLHITGAGTEYFADALTYLRIYLAGLMFTVIYNNGAGILRAIGDSHTPFVILAAACTVNIVLDLLFVIAFRMGIRGTALATVFSQFLSVSCIYVAIQRKLGIRCIDFGLLVREGKETVRQICSIGMAAGMQSALVGFSNLFVVRYMNLFDTASVAGIGIAQRVDKFIVLPVKSFGVTMTTFTSQNYGAADFRRIRQGKRQCLLLSLGVTITLTALVFAAKQPLVSLFSTDAQVVAVGVAMTAVLSPMYWTLAVRDVYVGLLRGYGKTKMPMLLSLLGMVGFRQLFLALTVARGSGIRYIYLCYPLAWLVTMLLILGYYAAVRNSLPGLGKEEASAEG